MVTVAVDGSCVARRRPVGEAFAGNFPGDVDWPQALAVEVGLLAAGVDIYRTIDRRPRRGAGLDNGEL